MSHHSNEIMIPLEMAAQMQPIPVPFIPPMESQHSPVTYEPIAEHQAIPVVDPVTKEVVTIVGRDFNQNQMPNVRLNIETEQHPPQIPIESISFQQNIIEENMIEEVSTQLENAAVQIESTSIPHSNHVDEIPVIPNIPDGTMVHTTITKSMSWTNQQQQHNNHHQQQHQSHQHHYNKKSTASVAVTATPTPSNGKTFTPSIKQQTASTTTTPSPQVKNHGAMKTPSSPVGVQSSSSTNKGTTTSTSTASATAIPQQLQEPKKTNKSQGPLFFTPPITNTQPQNNNPTPSWASLFMSSTTTTNYTTSSSSPVVPPTQTQNNVSSSSGSSSNNNTNINNPALPATSPQQQTSANNATTTTPIPTKPVAKVAPYESGAVSQPSPVVPQTQPQTISNNTTNSSFSTNPGALSYSAASAQSLSPAYCGGCAQSNNHNVKSKPQNSVGSTVNNKAATITTTTTNNTPTTTVSHKNQTSNVFGDEWSIKLAKFLTKYKPDYNAISLKPRGMMNKSNYCYINSILQALIGCPPFYNLLKNLPKQPTALQTEVKTPTLNAM